MTIRLVIEIDDNLMSWWSSLEPGSLRNPVWLADEVLAVVNAIRDASESRHWWERW